MLTDLFFAFIFGGLFCAIAQILIDKTSLTPAKILVFYVIFGVFLGAIGVYEPLFKLAGAGISLPLIGFGGVVAKGVRDAVDLYGIWGILRGPVAAMSVGVCAALLCGFAASLLFKSKSKRL